MDNILVNYAASSHSGQRFTDVQLVDLESTVHVTSGFCKDRDEIGTPIWRSPEAQLGLQWGPPTDIWSFGAMVIMTDAGYFSFSLTLINFLIQVISMIWGDNFFIFKPKVPRGHDDYEVEILTKYHIYFGPYPPSYADLADQETLGVLSLVMNHVPPEKLRPFSRASQREILKEDKEFVLKIMKLDPRDRPTAKELLEDEWFSQLPKSREEVETNSRPC
jgi:serine/threonine protein kinase